MNEPKEYVEQFVRDVESAFVGEIDVCNEVSMYLNIRCPDEMQCNACILNSGMTDDPGAVEVQAKYVRRILKKSPDLINQLKVRELLR